MPKLLEKTTYDDFSFYNIGQISAKMFEDDSVLEKLGWVSTWEDTPGTSVVVKNYENVEKKVRARGSGAGTIAFEGHVRYPVLVKITSMLDDTMRKGVYGYGSPSIHKPFLLVGQVENEDGEIMLVAYPQAIFREAPIRTITPNSEEIQPMSLSIAYMPDEYGYGRYEAKLDEIEFADDAERDEYVEKWITDWDITLVDPVV